MERLLLFQNGSADREKDRGALRSRPSQLRSSARQTRISRACHLASGGNCHWRRPAVPTILQPTTFEIVYLGRLGHYARSGWCAGILRFLFVDADVSRSVSIEAKIRTGAEVKMTKSTCNLHCDHLAQSLASSYIGQTLIARFGFRHALTVVARKRQAINRT